MAKRKPKERRPVECRPDPSDHNKFWTCLDGEHEIPIEVHGLSTPEELEWFGETMAKFLWEHRHLAKRDSTDLRCDQETGDRRRDKAAPSG